VSAQLVSILPFPSPVPPLLRLTSSHCRVVSCFLPIEPRWAHWLHSIFRECFIPSLHLSSWNRTIESAPPPQPPSLDHPTPTLHCYKNILLILVTLPTTQPRLHFISSLAKTPRHRSFTRHSHSLLSLSHAHCPSTQWHTWWWTSRPSFAFWIAYRYLNSRKKIFWNLAASRGVVN
jgi:hypothetical protein